MRAVAPEALSPFVCIHPWDAWFGSSALGVGTALLVPGVGVPRDPGDKWFLSQGTSSSPGSGRDLLRHRLQCPSCPGGHRVPSVPPASLAPCRRPPPSRPRAGRPPAPRPAPAVSRETSALPRQLCHKSGITVGLSRCAGRLPGRHTSTVPALTLGQEAVCPQARFAGAVVFTAKPREEQAVSGWHRPI